MFLILLLLSFTVFPLESLAHPEPRTADYRRGHADESEKNTDEFEAIFSSVFETPSNDESKPQPLNPTADSAESEEGVSRVSEPPEMSSPDTENSAEMSSPTEEKLPIPTVPEERTQIMSRSLGGNTMMSGTKTRKNGISKQAVEVTQSATNEMASASAAASAASAIAEAGPPKQTPGARDCPMCRKHAIIDDDTSTETESVTSPPSDYFLVTVPNTGRSLDSDSAEESVEEDSTEDDIENVKPKKKKTRVSDSVTPARKGAASRLSGSESIDDVVVAVESVNKSEMLPQSPKTNTEKNDDVKVVQVKDSNYQLSRSIGQEASGENQEPLEDDPEEDPGPGPGLLNLGNLGGLLGLK